MTTSSQLITDMKSAIATGPSATSTANANAASGLIADLPGSLAVVLLKLQEARVLLNAILTNDLLSGDAIFTTLSNVNNTLV